MNEKESRSKRLKRAAKGPSARSLPHPALDQPVETIDDSKLKLDYVVFGVTALIAAAFLVWGFVDTTSLRDGSQDGLDWTMKYLGWLFVLTASGFVVFAIWLAGGKYGNIPLGP